MPIINPNVVESPVLNERFLVSTGSALENVICPIDETPLINIIEYDFRNYSCPACGTDYKWGVKELSELEKTAKFAAQILQQDYNAGNILLKEAPKYEKLIAAAKKKGLL